MNDNQNFHIITDGEKRAALKDKGLSLVHDNWSLNDTWLRENALTTIPFEPDSHFSDKNVNSLLYFFNKNNYKELYALGLENDLLYRLETNREALNLFNNDVSVRMYNFILYPVSGDFAILCTVDYFILAASLLAVKDTPFEDVDGLRGNFEEYANSMSPEALRGALNKVGKRYSKYNS